MSAHSAEEDAPCETHDWEFDGYFWHRCTRCGAVS